VIRRIENDEEADETITDPPPELVVRESTAPLAPQAERYEP
jgi:LacI family transcriptional regulator